MQPLRIALTKGRLEKSTVQLFEQAGMDCSQLREKGRKLILPVGDGSLQAVLAKAADVITYVELACATWAWWARTPSWRTAATSSRF